MKRISFDYIVKAVISITGAELGRLMTLSRLHYDGKCRAAREHGGFLYGLCNQWIMHNHDRFVDFPRFEFARDLSPFALDESGSFTELRGLLNLDVEITLTPFEIGELESMYCSGSVPVPTRSMNLTSQFTGILVECSVEYDRIVEPIVNPTPIAATGV